MREAKNSASWADQVRRELSAPEIAGLQCAVDQLSQRIREIAWTNNPPPNPNPPAQSDSTFTSPDVVRSFLKARQYRFECLPAEFADGPAWDILLNLYSSYLEQRREMVSGAIAMSGLPSTTALRWLRALEEAGFVASRSDPFDGRRRYVALSEDAAQRMARFFRQASDLVQSTKEVTTSSAFSAAA